MVEIQEITTDELVGALDEFQLIDVRTKEVYKEGHIPSSIHIPLDDLPRYVSEIEWGSDIVFICVEGLASKQAAMLLSAYKEVDETETDLYNLVDGYEEWTGEIESSN